MVGDHREAGLQYSRWTYPLLEGEEVLGGEGVGLRDDGDEVDPRAESLHDLNVERLQPSEGRDNQKRQISDQRSIWQRTTVRMILD